MSEINPIAAHYGEKDLIAFADKQARTGNYYNAYKALLDHTRIAAKDGTLQHKLDRDRYIVAIGLGTIRKALDGHRWLLEGRGPYEWDDDRYRDEFTAWLENVETATGLLAKLAADLSDCATSEADVRAARDAARAYAVDAPKGHRDMLPADIGLPCPTCQTLSKDRDAVLEEAAERAAFVAGYRAAHMVPDAYDSTSAAEEAWEGYRLVSRNLKERV